MNDPPGATAFCDALADDVLQNIHNREALIQRLEKLHRESVVSRESRIQRLLYGIHNASLAVVEAIASWNRCKQQIWYRRKTIELHDAALQAPSEDSCGHSRCPLNFFLWNGQNYMRKMLSDMDFVAEIPEAIHFLGPTTSFLRNPFLLPFCVDEMALCSRDKDHQTLSDAKKMSNIAWKDVNIQRVQHASFMILLDEFHREVELSSSTSINEGNAAFATYAASRCHDVRHTTKFYPPELNAEDFTSLSGMLNPPTPCAIAICCASLILQSVDAEIMSKLLFLTKPIVIKIFRQPVSLLIDKAKSYNPLHQIDPKLVNIVYPFMMHEKMSKENMVDAPEPIGHLSIWLRYLLAREYDDNSVGSQSLSVEKVFLELEADSERREAKAGNAMKRQPHSVDDSNKENEDQCRNVSVQVQTEDIDHEQRFEKLDAFDATCFGSPSQKLVPFPVGVTVDLIERSQTVVVNGDMNLAGSLEQGDILRIYDPYESLDWEVLAPSCTSEDGKVTITLTKAYDHSRIESQEKKTRDDALYRLCYPYKKDTTPSPDRVLSNVQLDNHHDVASDRHSSTRSQLHIREARVWKLIPEQDDERSIWRKEYDDRLVPWVEDYTGSNKCHKHFRVRISLEKIEISCRDSPYPQCIHQQRVNFFEHVSLTNVINEAFHAVCRWHPKGSLIDNVKWAKLSRKMKFMSNIKNAKHEIDMAFVRHNNDRKLNLERFHAILEDIATMQYPAMPPDIALHKVVWASLVMVADVNGMMWKEAKTMAINTEAKRVCAQIRIASLVRKLQQSSRYRVAKVAVLIIETRVRQFLSRILVASLLRARNDDDIYKFHTRCSLLIQKSWRRYFWRNRFVQHQEQRVADQRQKIASIRAKLREQRKRDAESIVYRDVIRVDSTIAAVTIFFQDDSAFQENVVMLMKVYVPTTHETFTFRLEEKTVRDCLENSLSSPGKLSWNEMLNADALKELPKRLILRVVRGRPIFLFSRRNIVEKGTLLKKVAVLAADDVFILSLFRSPYEFAFVTYQPSTCDQMRTKLPNAKLSEWLRGSSPPPYYQLQQSEDCRDKSEGMLDLLKPERQKELLDWIVQRVLIRKHPDDPSAMQLLLQFEAEEERVVKLVTKVQSQWRRFRSLRQAKTQTFVQYEKIYNREYKMYAYRNVVTDERQWVKPKLLGDADLSSPVDEWRQVQAEDGSKYYVNYGTGQTSWLSEEDAARLVQRRYRSKHEADLLGDKMQFSDIVKAMHFIYGARTKYEEEPNKLSNMVNFAMVRHCLDLDFVGAKPVYEKAIKLSPNHPLISRAYGIFLLASRQPTELLSFQTATRLFAEADVSDPSQAQIRSAAQIYFRWAVMGNAKNPLALLNYALLHQCIYKEYDHAEKIYRAALAIDPTNTNVVENFSLFLRERYPGGAYASNGPPFSVVRRSVILEERPEWAEWQKLIDNMCPRKGFEVFYYNRFTKATQFDEPDWDEVYETRVKRSSVVSGKMTNWVEYWDPRLEESFFKNHATKKFTCAPYKQS